MEPSASQPNITAGEMLRRLHEEIITSPNPALVEASNQLFNSIFLQVTSLQINYDSSSEDVSALLKRMRSK